MKPILHDQIRKQEDIAFANRILAEHGMPVLLRIKPANTINIDKRKITNQSIFMKEFNKIVTSFDCKLWMLYEDKSTLLLILYDPEHLNALLKIYPNRQFLSAYGYKFEENMVDNILQRLVQRYLKYRKDNAEFPHEIGILLGYPIGDVEGFIRNRGKNYLYQGYWKVYTDVEMAKETFLQIHKAREIGKLSLAGNQTLCYTTLRQMLPSLGERLGKE